MKLYKLIVCFIFLLFAYFFTYTYLSSEPHLYNCDTVGYNLHYYDLFTDLKNHPVDFLLGLKYIFNGGAMNPSAVLPLLPFNLIFKDIRLGFIFSTVLIYLFPTMLLLLYIYNKFIKSEANKKEPVYTALILSSIFLFPILWLPTMKGVIDICGMVPCLFAYILFFKYGLNKNTPLKYIILISVLLYTAFLMRRWYSIVILCFVLVVLFENFITSVKNYQNKTEFIKYNLFSVLNISIVSVICATLTFFIQNSYFKTLISNETAERALYCMSYNQLNIIITENIGLIVFAISIFAAICCLKNKIIRFFSLNTFLFIFIYLVVMNNQLLWITHYNFLSCCFCILYCTGLDKITAFIKNRIAKNIFISLFIIYNILMFSSVFIYNFDYSIVKYLPQADGHPLKIENSDDIKDMCLFLKEECEKNPNIKIAIYGITTGIGYYEFRSLYPDSDYIKNNIITNVNEDFAYDTAELNADYIILIDNEYGIDHADSYRLRFEVQNMFREHRGFSEHYQLIKEFPSQNTYLYKQIKPLSKDDIKNFLKTFFEYYPEWEEQFKPIYE